MRIVSLLPSATEILFRLGLGDAVVGVSHECDWPPEAASRPVLVRPAVDPGLPSAEIDRRVSARLRASQGLYTLHPDAFPWPAGLPASAGGRLT